MTTTVSVVTAQGTRFTNSLFQEPWWLDAVAPGSWSACTVEHGGQVMVRWPLVRRDRLGFAIVGHPPLTQTLGPWVRQGSGKYETMLSNNHQLVEEALSRMPACDVLSQNLDPAITNPLPFVWAGYDVSPKCTYRLDDLSDLDRVWRGFSESCRRAMRKAEKHVVVRDDLSLTDFYDIASKTWARQGMSMPYARSTFERLDDACATRSCRRVLIAEDAQGRRHAGAYLVWDDRAMYYLVGGGDPELRDSGAASLVLYRAIQLAAGVTRVFDFEGSMNPAIERFFRSFGARQVTYYNIRRLSRRMRALTALRDLSVLVTRRPRRWFF